MIRIDCGIEPLCHRKANTRIPRPVPRVGDRVYVSNRLAYGQGVVIDINCEDEHGATVEVDYDYDTGKIGRHTTEYAFWHNCWLVEEALTPG